MTDITIPDEAGEAAGEAFLEADRVPSCSFDDAICAAILAALKAWPGASRGRVLNEPEILILPLPTQETDA